MMTIHTPQITSLVLKNFAPIVAELFAANRAFMEACRPDSDRRRAVHPVHGGVHLFEADSTGKLGGNPPHARGIRPEAADLARIHGEAAIALDCSSRS